VIPISGRFAPPLLLLLCLAAIPIVRHTYLGDSRDDCADPQALYDAIRIEGVAEAREIERLHRGARFQVTLGRLEKQPGRIPPPRFYILRSFSPSEFYMQPTYHLRGMFEADRYELEWIDAGEGPIPIQWQMGYTEGRSRAVGLVYVFGSRPVENPFRAQLHTVLDQLLHGTRPLTLFLASGYVPSERAELFRDPAREFFAAAWRYYKSVCLP
jgi:hypothetical protein